MAMSVGYYRLHCIVRPTSMAFSIIRQMTVLMLMQCIDVGLDVSVATG